MRKGKRFTPSLLKSWKLKGRGKGIATDYIAWHAITRGDPGSLGKSRIQNNNPFGRSMDYLSDTEFAVFCFVMMLHDLHDIREQYPLDLDEHPIDISSYEASMLSIRASGTLEIAESLGFSHPVVRKKGEESKWVLTSDLLITLKNPVFGYKLLALSVKNISPNQLSERQKELLRLEREYWTRQGVEWLLISSEVYCKSVVGSLKTYAPYAITDNPIATELIVEAKKLLPFINNMPLSKVLMLIENALKVNQSVAQKIFWEGVWRGCIPINLKRKPTPLTPINLISYEDFWQQNPIAVGRSSCL